MLVKVFNDNVHPYREHFQDREIVIPAKGFIKMEAGEALLFKGTFAPIKTDGDGNPIPEGYKMIRIEEIAGEEPEAAPVVQEFVCPVCKYKATSQADLDEHMKANHKDQHVVDPEAEKELVKRKKRSQ